MERTQFTFYESFYKAVSRMKKKSDQAEAYNAIIRLALYGEEPDLDGVSDIVAVALENIIPNILASNRKAENGKKGGEQKESKTEANDKQTASEKENEKENEIEIENECYNPLTPFEGELKQTFSEWLQYKREKRQSYKPTGLKSLVTQVANAVEKYGEAAVIEEIRDAMQNNYQGFHFDKIKPGRFDVMKEYMRRCADDTGGDSPLSLIDGTAVVEL